MMVTSTATSRIGFGTAAPVIDGPHAATILDDDGARLCRATVLRARDDQRLVLDDVDEPSALLDYYFGHAGRQILVSIDGCIIEGWLGTRWEGSHRAWWLDRGD